MSGRTGVILPTERLPLLVLLALGVALALAVGLAAGDPGPATLLPLGLVAGAATVGVVLVRPFVGLLIATFSVFFLIVVPVAGRSANPFDVVILPLLAVAVPALLAARRTEAAVLPDPRSHELLVARRRLERAVLLYFLVGALSLVPMAFRVGLGPAFDSALSLTRAVQGALLFTLGMLWLRDDRRIEATFQVVLVAGLLFAVVNGYYVLGVGYPRAGVEWDIGTPENPVAGPNEAGTALLTFWVLLQARRAVRPSGWMALLMALVLLLVPLTQSRSGLLAFATYFLLTWRGFRWRWLLLAGALALLAMAVVPDEYWIRLTRSVTLKRGSFELYSFLIRVYGFQTAWRVFLDNPVFGVGYLGFRFVSHHYNDLRVSIGQAENFFLETLSGLGVVGLAAVIFVLARLFALGRTVRRVVAPGTLGHEMGRRHVPLLVALLIANTTGEGFVGMIGLGQLAVWCALMVAAARLDLSRAAA